MSQRSSAPRKSIAQRPAARPTGVHTVRIIAGQWRRSILPIVDTEGLRPTPDRVRETVFNWITHLRGSLDEASVLDLFAGSGALGLEAASRGARAALLVELNPRAAASLKHTIERLKADSCRVEQQDAIACLAALKRRAQLFDLVFLDPPFHQQWLQRLLPGVLDVMAPDALLYIEAEKLLDQAQCTQAGLELLRTDKAGQVVYHLLRRNIDAAGPAPKNEEDESC
jgi:16S rRNA (guanine(966)-N(2))-methyltransferase RsmD